MDGTETITFEHALGTYRETFLSFLRAEGAESKLLCLEEIQEFKKNPSKTVAYRIFVNYISPSATLNSEKKVTVDLKDENHLKKIKDEIKAQQLAVDGTYVVMAKMFDPVETVITKCLEFDLFPRFLQERVITTKVPEVHSGDYIYIPHQTEERFNAKELVNWTETELSFPMLPHCLENVTDMVMHDILSTELAKKLEKVDLSSCYQITDRTISYLRNFPSITFLDLAGCLNITDRSVSSLASLKTLKYLNLYRCTNLTDQGLIKISMSPFKLEYLSVSHCYEISDEGLANISQQISLTELNLRYTKLTDNGCQSLTGLTNLKTLILYYCENITKEALKTLVHLPSLEVVNCRYTKVKAGSGTIWFHELPTGKKIKVIVGDK